MLKMKINNEEVVCDKEFTITKDILTTSSTTLKNCYPKSWEKTKDYVNNFYFPKDFSKCIIYDEEKIPGIQGLIAEGTNINLTYDNTLEKEITKISGDTYQQTYTGKNKFNIGTGTSTAQTVQVIKNGSEISFNGTANASNYLFNNISLGVFQAGTYTISAIKKSGSINTSNDAFIIYSGSTNYCSRSLYNIPFNRSFTLTENTELFCKIWAVSGMVYTNYVINIQLEQGSSPTSYEPYVGGIPSPNPNYPQNIEVVTGRNEINITGKNLLDISENNDYVTSNASQSYLEQTSITFNNGSCVVNATALPSGKGRGDWFYVPLKIGVTYTLKFKTDGNFANIRLFKLDKSTTLYNSTSISEDTYTFTAIESGVYFRLWTGPTTATLNYAQLEVGNQATEYEEFKEQTYQIDLAEYDNLFTSTLESGGISSIDGQNIDNDDYLRTKTYINVDGTKHYTIEFTKEVTMEVYYYLANNNYIGWEAFGGENKYTFYPENVDKIKIVIRDNTITTDDIMLTEGSDITPSKYIELCKIGNYQDYIYKENDKWYKHSEIGKVVLDGSETYTGVWWDSTTPRKGARVDISNALYPTHASQYLAILGDKYTSYSQEQLYRDTTFLSYVATGICIRANNSQLIIKNNNLTLSSDTSEAVAQAVKSWVTTNGLTVYYVLSTPTNTLIEDVNLINQLENLPLYEGINNITMINGNLTSSIKIHYNYENPTTIIDTIFSGLVKNTGNISLNPRDPHYCSLQILDFKDLLSTGETLDFVISEKTVQEAIQMVVDEISDYGFQVGTINLDSANEVIGTYSTLNKTAYDVFQYLANITQSKWFTRMIDDNNIAIDFYDIDKLDTKNDIEYNEQYFENNNIVDISYNYSTKDYRNKQIMLSKEVFANIDYNETIITDGYNKIFTIGNNIGVLKNLSLNGVPMSVGTSDDKERGIIADFYYTVGSNIIESDSLISAGNEIEFTYTPLVKGRQIIVNDDEINRVGSQINRNGTISRYETRNDSLSAEELQNIGESYLKYKGKAEITLKVKTINNDLYNIGDMVYFQAPLTDLQVQYMVKKKTINVLATTGDIFYTYELTNTYNSENEINYFDNQRAKANGNISSNDYITRNIDIDNNATIIFNNLGIQEITATGDNLLDCALNSPFNN